MDEWMGLSSYSSSVSHCTYIAIDKSPSFVALRGEVECSVMCSNTQQ